MKRITTILAATALSATMFAGVANAASLFGQAQTGASAVQTMNGDNFSLVVLHANDNGTNNAYYNDYVTNPGIHKAEIAAVQRAVLSNKSLSSALRARNVQLNNIVGADQAANGSVTFYLR